jgi:hypothetical protein
MESGCVHVHEDWRNVTPLHSLGPGLRRVGPRHQASRSTHHEAEGRAHYP